MMTYNNNNIPVYQVLGMRCGRYICVCDMMSCTPDGIRMLVFQGQTEYIPGNVLRHEKENNKAKSSPFCCLPGTY